MDSVGWTGHFLVIVLFIILAIWTGYFFSTCFTTKWIELDKNKFIIVPHDVSYEICEVHQTELQ